MTAPTYDSVRQALYARLDAVLTCDVWSPRAPQADDSELTGPFPYVVIVQVNESAWNTKGSRGLDALVQIDGYARATETDSVETVITLLAAQVREALEWYALPVAGHVTTELESTIYGWEGDTRTRRFVSLFRVIVDEA